MPSYALKVDGMTCDHCKGKVEAALKSVSGTYAVMVDIEDGVAEVDTSDEAVAVGVYVAAVTAAGYEASPEA
jgi:copper chaperone CopZ